MAHPRGFEPLTARFVAEYSIQLSYGCADDALIIHQYVLELMPHNIPEEEQTYFLANVYGLVLDQPHVLERLR